MRSFFIFNGYLSSFSSLLFFSSLLIFLNLRFPFLLISIFSFLFFSTNNIYAYVLLFTFISFLSRFVCLFKQLFSSSRFHDSIFFTFIISLLFPANPNPLSHCLSLPYPSFVSFPKRTRFVFVFFFFCDLILLLLFIIPSFVLFFSLSNQKSIIIRIHGS